MMPWTLLSFLWTLILFVSVDSITLPAIHWNASNPMFKASNNDHIIEVNLNDEVDFVCPYFSDEMQASDRGYYIIYQVTKREYEDCNLYTSTTRNMIVNCSTPRTRKRFTIIFERYSPVPNGQEFQEGGTYYYISTSSGYEEGLMNQHHGACYYDNMKLTIKVCCDTTTDLPPSPSPSEPWLPPPTTDTTDALTTTISSAHFPMTDGSDGSTESSDVTVDESGGSSEAVDGGGGGDYGDPGTVIPETSSSSFNPSTATTTTTPSTTTTHEEVFPTNPRWQHTTATSSWSPPKTTLKPDETDENEVYPIKEGLVNSGALSRLCLTPWLVLICQLIHTLYNLAR